MIKKKHIILTIILLLFLLNIDISLSCVKNSTIMFFNNIFVSIFPFIILNEILIYYEYHIFLSKIFNKILSKIFNINKNSIIVFILSILTSMPNNSVYLKTLLDNKLISLEEANKLLTFTYFPSISFVIGSIGFSLYDNSLFGIYLLIINYIYNICIGIYLRKYKFNYIISTNNNKKKSLFGVLKDSIMKSFNTCLIILGNIIIFNIIISLINNYISINPIISSIFNGLLEITSGIYNISNLNINIKYKFILSSFIVNFSSISIIFQSFSILSDYKIDIKRILITKLVFSIIFSIILLFIC